MQSRNRSSRPAPRILASALAASLAEVVASCGGGGGGGGGASSAFASHARLLAVTFPDPGHQNTAAADQPPVNVSLVQQVVFVFSGDPDPRRVSSLTLPVRDASGFSVPGRYSVDGATVTFTPSLPTQPISQKSETQLDPGGSGLEPGATYFVRASPSTWSFIRDVDPILRVKHGDPVDPTGVLLTFQTTSDPTLFFTGLPPDAPSLVGVDPADGTIGVSPGLYSDPGRLFPASRPFTLRFDHPVQPATTNVGDATFALVDLDDLTSGFPGGVELGIDVSVVENEVDHALVQVTPNGILPFGHLLALEIPVPLQGLSQGSNAGSGRLVATTFTTAAAPPTTIQDDLVEDFDGNARQETDPSQIGIGQGVAEWNKDGSHVLTAGFAFSGDGGLGRFAPPPGDATNPHVVTLDTSSQVFPLFDGSTPDAPPGLVVLGGVFAFSDIDIPDTVELHTIGPNPLVLTATGSVHIAGKILVNGVNGTPEDSHDSAVTSTPGGPGGSGGGRGGVGHPIIFYPPDEVSVLNLVSPPTGGDGYGPAWVDGALVFSQIGGRGGQCGALDHADVNGLYTTDQEINCNEFSSNNSCGEKVTGGGGGSFLAKGKSGGDNGVGIGNVLPTGIGTYIVRPWVYTSDPSCQLIPGVGGDLPFFDDHDSTNDFIGARGQLQHLQGGQGGGGGASKIEGYYCGVWCLYDSDPTNDGNCNGTDFGNPPAWADSVGDAKGGGAGGGGGAIEIQALGSITLDSTGSIQTNGGAGGGGEALGCSYWGAGGGGGSGGAILLQSSTSVVVQAGATIQTQPGKGDHGTKASTYFACNKDGGPCTGGNGGSGIIQLQVPAGGTATVVDVLNSIQPVASWVDPTNTLNPVEFTPVSVAVSKWYDLGRTTKRPPAATNPVFAFGGLDSNGFVPTDVAGNVLDPTHTDVECDYLGQIDPLTHLYRSGQEPKADFIPPDATVRVEFQGANPIVEGSKEVDPATITPWSPTVGVANSMQFVRWRVTFDLTAKGGTLGPDSPRPTVQHVRIGASF